MHCLFHAFFGFDRFPHRQIFENVIQFTFFLTFAGAIAPVTVNMEFQVPGSSVAVV